MGLLSKLFGKREQPQMTASPEHSVIVHFAYGSTDLGPLFALEGELEAAISKAGAGLYDGNEIAVDGSDGRLFMYGPDADRLFEVVKPILESSSFMQGASAALRYGPHQTDARETEVTIGG